VLWEGDRTDPVRSLISCFLRLKPQSATERKRNPFCTKTAFATEDYFDRVMSSSSASNAAVAAEHNDCVFKDASSDNEQDMTTSQQEAKEGKNG
jgi:hypothetical protein